MSRVRIVDPLGSSWLALVLIVAGCGGGDGLPREPVSGNITLGGQPLESGTITFMPADLAGDVTPVAATIKDNYCSMLRGDGPIPGADRVSVSSPRPDTPSRAAGPSGRRMARGSR